MADGHGGHRTPRNPAPVSGPGKMSRRTDGGPGDKQPTRVAPGGEYGSRKEMEAIQGGAPMQGGGNPAGDVDLPQGPPPTPLGADTRRPDEPVTAGAPVGDGIGPQAAGIDTTGNLDMAAVRPLIRSLEDIANMPGSNPATRAFVRALKAKS